MRGRVQLEWRSTTQTRANATLTWLTGQLTGRQFTTPKPATAANVPGKGWTTTAEILFTTPQEGEVVRALCAARQTSDSTIAAGSWWQYHDCSHDEGNPICSATRVTK